LEFDLTGASEVSVRNIDVLNENIHEGFIFLVFKKGASAKFLRRGYSSILGQKLSLEMHYIVGRFPDDVSCDW